MFTGIIETTGIIKHVTRGNNALTLHIHPQSPLYHLKTGASVAVDGVCLTVTRITHSIFQCTATHETLKRTTLANAGTGAHVNLERALKSGDRFDGHMVSGHIDDTGIILNDRTVGDSIIRTIRIPSSLNHFMAPKGSVAVDGISLTIIDPTPESISISIIPYTYSSTTCARKQPGDTVNLECDIVARYIFHILSQRDSSILYETPESNKSETNFPPGGDLLTTLERSGF